MCSIAFSAVRDIAESEEIAQEVYLSAWKQLRSLRSPRGLLPWLRQLTRNESVDHLKKRKRARWVQGEEAEGVLAGAADDAPSIERVMEHRACVLEQVAGAAFPNVKGEGMVTVRYPFIFDPGGGFGGSAPTR